MTSAVVTAGIDGTTYKTLFRKQIRRAKPAAVGMAVAYVSVSGFNLAKKMLDDADVGEVRLVTDARDGVTHPEALRSAVASGWNVRIVDDLAGTFHPKLYVGAAGFDDARGVSGISLVIVGSPNLSRAGFLKNGECVFYGVASGCLDSAAGAWLDCWKAGVPATTDRLSVYEDFFASRNRRRDAADMVAIGVADDFPGKTGAPPKTEHRAISEAVASVAWAGLQSFTGEYSFQVEFPKEAGLVLRRIVGNLSERDRVDMLCADGVTRSFKFKFYENNGMFRLSVPNATPMASWARERRVGIARVERGEARGDLLFDILAPGLRLEEVVDRSRALGTWGRTPTRLYGWH